MLVGLTPGDFYASVPWEIIESFKGFLKRQEIENARAANLGILIYAPHAKNPRQAYQAVKNMFFGSDAAPRKPKTREELAEWNRRAQAAFDAAKEK